MYRCRWSPSGSEKRSIPPTRHAQPPVRRRGRRAGGPLGASTRRTSDSHRAVSATCSITSLAQTRSNSLSSNGSGPSIGTSRKSSSGWRARARAERRLGDVDPDRLRAPPAASAAVNVARAAADVQRPVPGAHLRAQERQPHVEIRRLEIVRQVAPTGPRSSPSSRSDRSRLAGPGDVRVRPRRAPLLVRVRAPDYSCVITGRSVKVAFDSRPAKDHRGVGRYARCLLEALHELRTSRSDRRDATSRGAATCSTRRGSTARCCAARCRWSSPSTTSSPLKRRGRVPALGAALQAALPRRPARRAA